MTDLISVTVNDGKYTIQQTEAGRWEALRHGEQWPAMASGPDNLHVALAYEIHELREKLNALSKPQMIPIPMKNPDPAVTAHLLAGALDAFWNAAIGHAHRDNATSLAMDTITAMAEGFAAVSAELRKGGDA